MFLVTVTQSSAHLIWSPLYMLVCVSSYYKGIRQMVPVSDQDMNTHLAEVSRVRNTAVIFFAI